MSLLSERNKIILFGLLGAAGCVVGGLAGEGLYGKWLTPDGEPSAPSLVERVRAPTEIAPLPRPPDPPPAPPPQPPAASQATAFPPEFKERLDRERAQQGDLEIALAWQDFNDVDLACFEPDGTIIWAIKRQSSSLGKLDIDMNGSSGGPGGSRSSNTPVEHITWPRGRIPAGRYRVEVSGFQTHGGPDTTRFAVAVRSSDEIAVKLVGGERLPVTGEVSFPKGEKLQQLLKVAGDLELQRPILADHTFAFEFDVRPVEPALKLAVPAEVRINQGGQSTLSTRIARTRFGGPVKLQLTGGVEDIVFQEAVIAADKTQGEILLQARDAARSGERLVKVIASGGGLQTEADLKLTVLQLPAGLRLSAPPELPVNQGTANSMLIRIARDHFRGPVELRFSGDLKGLSLQNLTISPEQSEIELKVQADAKLTPGPRDVRVIATGGGASAEATFQVAVQPQQVRAVASWSWLTLLQTSAWTALLAVGLSMALVMGQNRHLGKALMSIRQLAWIVAGGLAAGLLAGALSQTIFYGLTRLALMPQLGLLAGWLLLGGLLARGVGAFVPNLPPGRAVVAGLVGGLLGALVFLGVSQFDDRTGRLIGAAILGFCIGLMVAVVEAVFRTAWVEVIYGPKEMRRVSLGLDSVSVGGYGCTIVVREAPIKLSYTFKDGQIYCRNGESPPVAVPPGDERAVGAVRVIARAQGAAALATATSNNASGKTAVRGNSASPARSLRLDSGRVVPLPTGARLSTADLPGIEPAVRNGWVAEVVSHPTSPGVVGLKNCSAKAWTVRMPDGTTNKVEHGRSVRLASGTNITFGTCSGELI